MRAGKLDRKIVVERLSRTVNDIGDVTETWSPLVPLRAEMIQNSTKDFLLAGDEAHASRKTVVFRARFVPGVTLDDRVSYEGTPFKILEIKEIGRRRGLEFRCERVGK